jgi:hypothetical protein
MTLANTAGTSLAASSTGIPLRQASRTWRELHQQAALATHSSHPRCDAAAADLPSALILPCVAPTAVKAEYPGAASTWHTEVFWHILIQDPHAHLCTH